jgi:alginate O-acetyltransferase complex protein AlgI
MEFSSSVFLFLFLPVFLTFFFVTRKAARNLFLLLASLVFYAWGEGGYILVLLLSIIANRVFASLIDKAMAGVFKKAVFVAAIVFNLGLLAFFKYTAFILQNLGLSGTARAIHLPLGISFFTFQAISYLVDIYRKTASIDRNPVNFALYMAFFPKLASGPLAPYHNLAKQIAVPEFNISDVGIGVQRFIIGLGKKILIADSMAKIANPIFALPAGQQTAALAWLGIISFALQIYFDFSGYSDMAVGIGRMCGFRLPENFNYPYFAKSIREFWTRWHISLAQWLRDYLFLPIAYSMLRKIRNDRWLRVKAEDWSYYIGTFFTFLLCGIWHGANWTFVLWGLFYGALLICEHAGLDKFMKKRAFPIRLAYTQLLVIVAWVLFRSPTPAYAFSYLLAMFGLSGGNGNLFYPSLYLDAELIFFLLVGIVFSFPIIPAALKRLEDLAGSPPGSMSKIKRLILDPGVVVLANLFWIAVLLISIVFLVAGTYQPFIYSRF